MGGGREHVRELPQLLWPAAGSSRAGQEACLTTHALLLLLPAGPSPCVQPRQLRRRAQVGLSKRPGPEQRRLLAWKGALAPWRPQRRHLSSASAYGLIILSVCNSSSQCTAITRQAVRAGQAVRAAAGLQLPLLSSTSIEARQSKRALLGRWSSAPRPTPSLTAHGGPHS